MKSFPLRGVGVAAALVASLAGCNKGAPAFVPPPPEVAVLTTSAKPAQLSLDVVGEIRAYREVDLKSRASGNLVKINFKPGQRVKEGDLLFVIDPATYDAAVSNAEASMAEAAASLARVRQDLARYKELLPDNAIPRQTYEQAVAQETQALAVLEGRRVGVQRARLDRDYTRVTSPVSGQIGLQKVEVGGLVSAGQTSLAVVSTLDPVVVYFSVSETDYLAYVRRTTAAAAAGKPAAPAPVQLVLADGQLYGDTGRIDFSDRAVNSVTGTLALRAVFPNPKDLLRPGMTSRVRLVYDEIAQALLVPQKSVTETLGKHFLTVIGGDGKVEVRPVRMGQRIGDEWLVEQGLKPGEVIVVEGMQKVRAGQAVKTVPLGAPKAASVAN